MSLITGVILAAGAGRRLGDLGKQYSKPMVPILGRPLIAWVMERLRQAGVARLIVVGHATDIHLRELLASCQPPVDLVVQEQRRGIADALRLALPLVGQDKPCLACACDSLFELVDLERLVAAGLAHTDRAYVAVLDMGLEATQSRSSVRLQGDRVVEIVEKPKPGEAPSGLVAMPLYWLPPKIAPSLEAAAVPDGESYVTTALADFAARGGDVRACRVRGRIEVTNAADVTTASDHLAATMSQRKQG